MKVLTKQALSFIIIKEFCAGIAQLAEQLICNQQVVGSIPIASSNEKPPGNFVSGLFYFSEKDSFCFFGCNLAARWLLLHNKKASLGLRRPMVPEPTL